MNIPDEELYGDVDEGICDDISVDEVEKKLDEFLEFVDDSDNETSDVESNNAVTIKSRCKWRYNDREENNAHIKAQPVDKVLQKYSKFINMDPYASAGAMNHVLSKEKRMNDERMRVKDKKDRATSEQVMDPRVRMILFKMLNRKKIDKVHGCISTGKEANVYYATAPDGKQLALKIYKSSTLTFKKRDKYVSGEFRWRNGYCKQNPRKMVTTWAEKEMRNLRRMHAKGLNVPQPLEQHSTVLLMTFIGEDGWPARKLKDVDLSGEKAGQVYREVIVTMWKMNNLCRLIHGDLSEYNILYQNKKVCFIDVSQSVEHDHPRAKEFLTTDCTNINNYFKKLGVPTLRLSKLFNFITDPTINESNMEKELDELAEEAAQEHSTGVTQDQEVEEEIFKNMYIPKRMDEVDEEKDAAEDNAIYKALMNLKPSKEEENEGSSDESEESNGSDCSVEEKSKFKNSARPSNETTEEKKARKEAVRQEKAEKRKNKMKKHIKKRKVKCGKKD